LWLHQRIREDALAKDGGGDARDKQNDAKARIRAKIEKAMSSKKLATRKTAARGQQSLQKSKESSDWVFRRSRPVFRYEAARRSDAKPTAVPLMATG